MTSDEDNRWQNFASDDYVAHYYADPHPDDELLAAAAARAFRQFAPSGGLNVVDVGTGPNLYPLLAALPYAGRLTAWEYADSNIAWLQASRSRGALEAPWDHYWRTMHDQTVRQAIGVDPGALLERRLEVVQGSIFDLPVGRFDAASMFFCAESITSDLIEFRRACRSFASSVKAGGLLVAAFLAGSRGYSVGDHDYPAVPIDDRMVAEAVEGLVSECEVRPVGAHDGEIRSGYSGALLLRARRASD